MEKNNVKTILFASLIVAIILSFSMTNVSSVPDESVKQKTDKVSTDLKNIADEISKDMEQYVKDDSADKVDETTKLQQVKGQYSNVLDMAIENVLDEADVNYDALYNAELDLLKQLIIQEELKWAKINDYEKKANADAFVETSLVNEPLKTSYGDEYSQWVQYDKDGNVKLKLYYDENGQLAEEQHYDENENLKSSTFYLDGQLTEELHYEYENDNLKSTKYYRDGQLVIDKHYEYDDNGDFKLDEYYVDSSVRYVSEYYENQSTKSVKRYVDGQLERETHYKYESENLQSQFSNLNSRDLTKIKYFENGNIKSIEYHIDGHLKHESQYFENGHHKSAKHYADGHLKYKYQFDEYGNPESIKEYDKHGNLIDHTENTHVLPSQ